MAKAPSKQYLMTPVGTVEPYCYIQKPDFGNEQFKQPRGVYKLSLTLTSALAQPLIDKIVKCHEESYKAALADHKKNPPAVQRGKKPLEPYEGDLPFFDNGDGTVTFKFAMYATYTKDDEIQELALKVVDSKGQRINQVPAISGGSEVKVRFSLFPYKWNPTVGASVKLQLDSIMLVKLVEYQAGGDDWAGQEEEGFVAEGNESADWRQDDHEEPSQGHAREQIPDADDDF